MSGEWDKWQEDNVWYCLREGNWVFGSRRFRRHGQAVKAARIEYRRLRK